MSTWKFQRTKQGYHSFYLDFAGNKSGWESGILLSSDWHLDSKKCDRDLLKRHLDRAVSDDCPVIITGDMFDLMQGRKDPRKSMADLRPEHIGDDYFNLVVETSLDFLEPYAKNIALITYGNHETSMIRHNDFDILQAVYHRMRDRFSSKVLIGGYGAYIICRAYDEGGKIRGRHTIRTFHGAGGGGPVTKGVIGTNRRGAFMADADTIHTGHIHESWVVQTMKERIAHTGEIYTTAVNHICTPSYKQEFDLGTGFHSAGGRPPKPVGAAWLKFRYESKENPMCARVELDTRQGFTVQ